MEKTKKRMLQRSLDRAGGMSWASVLVFMAKFSLMDKENPAGLAKRSRYYGATAWRHLLPETWHEPFADWYLKNRRRWEMK